MNASRALTLIIGTSLLMLGCGRAAAPLNPKLGTTQVPAPAVQPTPAWPVANPQPGLGVPQPAQPGAGGDVQTYKAALAAVHAQLPGLSAQIDTFDKGPKGQESNSIRIAYRKPHTMKIEMVKASGAAQGAQILWTGGDTLKVKPRFLPMAVDKSIQDEQTVSKNGWTIRDTGVQALFRVFLDPAAQMRSLGSQTLEGRTVVAIEVRSSLSPSGATHEIIALDPVKSLPAARMVYRGQELIYRAVIKSMTVKSLSQSELSI